MANAGIEQHLLEYSSWRKGLFESVDEIRAWLKDQELGDARIDQRLDQVIGKHRHPHRLAGNADQETQGAEHPDHPTVEEGHSANVERPARPYCQPTHWAVVKRRRGRAGEDISPGFREQLDGLLPQEELLDLAGDGHRELGLDAGGRLETA